MVRFTTAAAALLAVSAGAVRAEEAAPEASVEPYVPKTEFQYEFLETFQGDDVIKTKRWVQSSKDKYSGQSWVHATEFETVESGIVGDKSLITAVPHKHYGIVRALDTPVDPKGKDLVVQYEVRLNKGIGCSGAYLKLIAADDAFEPEQLSEDTGFSVMFGPDKCGGTNKVHLIIRVQNPITKEWEEKHMTKPVPTETDNLSHLYTLVIRNDDTFKVMVDSVVKAEGTLMDDFKPSFQEPEEIDDTTDSKPEDWVEEAKIADPEASKPDDWDEDAAKMIADPEASKPEGWEDDEPTEVADPSASMPEDWDEDDDGVWEAPLVANPKCSVGCGEWKAPQIANPEYKGKWSAPMIDNPEYKGKWAPRLVANPGYFKVEKASDFSPIGAVAIEILANDKGIGFDNILIGHSESEAAAFATATHGLKNSLEETKTVKAKRDSERKAREDVADTGGAMGLIKYWFGEARDIVVYNKLAVGITSGIAFLVFLVFIFKATNEKPPAAKYEAHKKTDEGEAPDDDDEDEDDEDEEEVDEVEEVEDEEEEEEQEPAVRQRRTPKAD